MKKRKRERENLILKGKKYHFGKGDWGKNMICRENILPVFVVGVNTREHPNHGDEKFDSLCDVCTGDKR